MKDVCGGRSIETNPAPSHDLSKDNRTTNDVQNLAGAAVNGKRLGY